MLTRGIRNAMVIFMTGALTACATPSYKASVERMSGSTAPGIHGIWKGSSESSSSALYYVDLRLSLQIYDDGAYVLSATPGSRGNNVGKPFIEVGQAYERGRDLVLRTEDGSTRVLRKSGDTLYGMAEDPLSGRSVIDRLDRIS